MITWLSQTELEQILLNHPPIGLRLRSFYQGRLDRDPQEVVVRASDKCKISGVGMVDAWSGIVEGVPFTITSRNVGPGWGFEIAFPAMIVGARLDISLLHRLRTLPAEFASCNRPYFDTLPFAGAGFGVVELGDDAPLFTSPSRDDVAEVVGFLSTDERSRYHIVKIDHLEPAWIVAGPASGPYVSWLEVVPDEASAKRLARECEAETGHAFTVHFQDLGRTDAA